MAVWRTEAEELPALSGQTCCFHRDNQSFLLLFLPSLALFFLLSRSHRRPLDFIALLFALFFQSSL